MGLGRPIAFLSLETMIMLKKIRKAIKYLSKPRQFMYLYALLAVFWLHAFYLIYEDKYLRAKFNSDQEKSFDKTFQIDMNTGRKSYDSVFDPDEAIREKRIGKIERYFNICNSVSCRLIGGLEPTRDVCNNELSTSRKFHKYRVYSCSLKITLENDEPMDCTRVVWSSVKGLCERLNDT